MDVKRIDRWFKTKEQLFITIALYTSILLHLISYGNWEYWEKLLWDDVCYIFVYLWMYIIHLAARIENKKTYLQTSINISLAIADGYLFVELFGNPINWSFYEWSGMGISLMLIFFKKIRKNLNL